jgi:hypothetical protein
MLETGHIDFWTFDLPARALAKTGTAPITFYFTWPLPSAEGLVVRTGGKEDRSLDLLDGSTGAPRARLVTGFERAWPLVLADGRIVCIGRGKGGEADTLRVFTHEGALQGVLSLPPRLRFSPMEHVEGNKILLGAGPEKGRIPDWDAYLADLGTGAVEPVPGLRVPQGYVLAEPRQMVPETGGRLKWLLLLNAEYRLVRYDWRTGERFALLPLSPPPKTGRR